MDKYVNGVLTPCTEADIAKVKVQKEEADAANLVLYMENFRSKRNKLLEETDYLGTSDNTMSSAMVTYRQELRDATIGIETIDQIFNYKFPTKPE